MKIGIIGIGMLGEAVVLNLLNSGHNVSVYNRTKEKTIEVEKKGAKVMDSPKIMAENVELIIIVVKDAGAVRDVSFGEKGIIESKNKKLIVNSCLTHLRNSFFTNICCAFAICTAYTGSLHCTIT